MLESLYVKDLALLEELRLDIGAGLSCFTGETGAGKSLLIGAIQGIHGARMGREWIREGAEFALIEAVFTEVGSLLDPEEYEMYLADEDEDLLILTREISRTGRGLCRINGNRVTLRALRELGSKLSQIHGQHEAQGLFDPEEQLSILDRYAGDELFALQDEWRALRSEIRDIQKLKHQLVADPEKRSRVYRLLDRQVKAIDEVAPKPGEMEALEKERKVFLAAQQAYQQIHSALRLLSGAEDEESSSLDKLQDARREFQVSQRWIGEKKLNPLLERFDRVYEDLSDLSLDLQRLQDSLDLDPESYEEVEARLKVLQELEASFDRKTDEIIEYRKILDERRQALLDSDKEQERLLKVEAEKLAELDAKGQAIRALRYAAGETLVEAVQGSLGQLAMPHAEFSVVWTKTEPGPRGVDRLEFYFTANPGEPAKPLASVASGGEASRIMLALKVVLAEADEVPLLIFDEVDQGISGDTATQVGKQMRALGQTHQVLAVTHQAQLAVQAQQHFYLYKEVRDARTRTLIKELNADERVEELARLLGSSLAKNEALALAKQMLAHVSSS